MSMSIAKTKLFHLGDILSITTGRLMGPGRMGGVYAILEHLSGVGELYTPHQILHAVYEITPALKVIMPEMFMDSSDGIVRRAIGDMDSELAEAGGDAKKLKLAVEKAVNRIAAELKVVGMHVELKAIKKGVATI